MKLWDDEVGGLGRVKVEYGVESPNNSSHGDEEVKEEIKQMQVKTSKYLFRQRFSQKCV